MTLGELVSLLQKGPLRSIATKDDIDSIVSYTNVALQALYNRFNLKTSEQIIPLKDNIVEYKLNPDVMVIEGIYDENGDEFVLDDDTNRFGILQVDFETIQVANPSTGATLGVVYKASPEILIYQDENSLNKNIPLPPQLLEPLLHYIGYIAYGSINNDIKEENNTYYMRYEASCKMIERLGLVKKSIPPAHLSQHEGISETIPVYNEIDLNNKEKTNG